MATFLSTDERLSTALDGQYEIEREIGRGGMGVVFLARDLRLDRMVAIKTLPTDKAGDPAIRDRFLREARMAARLAHPNIVPIHRADEIDGQVFFVMGFVDGDSVAARLATRGPLSPREAVPILRDVAAALGYAHTQGVIHRDVKTENVLLDSLSGRALVTDFGIAFATEAAPLTATGQILGTVYYLSPEQVAGDRVDARSDIYALGVAAYAMLAGKFPFDAPLASAVLVAHVTKQALPLSVAAPHVPASLSMIIERCLAKDPAHRFQTCAELDAALGAAKGDADRVVVSATKAPSPLVSKTEAQAILGRAAELDGVNSDEPRPLEIRPRDKEADARRREGFKTQNLREAAAEVGIGAASMERALAERGLRGEPTPRERADNRPTKVVHDLTRKPTFWEGDQTLLHYEMTFKGEVPEDDYNLFVERVRSHWMEPGNATTLGRALNWRGTSLRGRILEVTIQPRATRTTLTIRENTKRIRDVAYGVAVAGFGLLFGGMLSIAAADAGVASAVAVFGASNPGHAGGNRSRVQAVHPTASESPDQAHRGAGNRDSGIDRGEIHQVVARGISAEPGSCLS